MLRPLYMQLSVLDRVVFEKFFPFAHIIRQLKGKVDSLGCCGTLTLKIPKKYFPMQESKFWVANLQKLSKFA